MFLFILQYFFSDIDETDLIYYKDFEIFFSIFLELFKQIKFFDDNKNFFYYYFFKYSIL